MLGLYLPRRATELKRKCDWVYQTAQTLLETEVLLSSGAAEF
jgi:hypothetical protein